MDTEKLPFEPPEPDYVAEQYIIKIPATDKHFKSPWELRKYATKLLEDKIGDYAQLTSLKVKHPSKLARAWAKLLRKEPLASLYMTVKF
jgi:hypothetical protein